MIDFVQRVQDVKDLLACYWKVDDEEAVEILLATRIPNWLPYPWIILETEYYSLEVQRAWFAMANTEVAMALPLLRVNRPRRGNIQVQELLADRHVPRLFVEPHWEQPVRTHQKYIFWPYLTQQCVRIRSRYPKTIQPTMQAYLKVEQAVAKLFDPEFRDVKSELPVPPNPFLYYCELLQRLSGRERDWDILVQNLRAIAGRRAYLFNREVDESDWRAVVRVMKDTVPYWTGQLIQKLTHWNEYRRLKERSDFKLIRQEMLRLKEEGIVTAHYRRWQLMHHENRGEDVLALVKGDISL